MNYERRRADKNGGARLERGQSEEDCPCVARLYPIRVNLYYEILSLGRVAFEVCDLGVRTARSS